MIEIVPYFFLSSVVFLVNLVPGFMPPTWAVLTFFTVKYDLSFFPTIILGAIFAVSGRIILAHLSQRYFRRFLSKKSEENFDSLGIFLQKNEKATLPFIIAYAFSPIPSNQLFIIAGLTRFNIRLLAFSFFVGRLISYTFWVGMATTAAESIEAVFANRFSSTGSVILEILGFAVVILLSKVNWSKYIRDHHPKETPAQ